jgi:hypothetical protein
MLCNTDNRIIVGVKYCFRYSRRNRQPQLVTEEVDLATLPPYIGLHHPVQRRRREKKLLKIDEVNERFPTMTYKAWREIREKQGLNAEGGIASETLPTVQTPPESRAGTPPPTDLPITQDILPPTNDPTQTPSIISPNASPNASIHTTTNTPTNNNTPDNQFPSPLPSPSSEKSPEIILQNPSSTHNSTQTLPNNPNDNCAICIDPLEQQDPVRGLTCGHCYHQSCLDPWLTQRRASCPLCKADYYVPRPREDGDEGWMRSRRSLATGNLPNLNVERGETVGRWRWFRVFRRGERNRGGRDGDGSRGERGGRDGSALERGS